MFEYLYGTVEYKKMEYIALDINGVGYKIYISLKEYEKIKKQLSRSSTKPEVWHRYIKFITEHRCNKQKYQYIPINENGLSEFDELANWIRDFTLQTDYSGERRKQHF